MKKMVVAASLVLGVATGCGSTTSSSSDRDSPPSASTSASPTPAQVSTATVCQILFPEDGVAPLVRALRLISKDNPSQDQIDQVRSDVESLERLARQAPSAPRAQIGTFTTTYRPYLEEVDIGDSNPTVDTTALQASALELTNICG